MAIPPLNAEGKLPEGVHETTLQEVESVFGSLNDRRKLLMSGLMKASQNFKEAGVPTLFIDGSFTTDKEIPKDIDGCWSAEGVDFEKVDPVFWKFNSAEEFKAAKAEEFKKYGLDFYIAEAIVAGTAKRFPEFFQSDRNGNAKGILKVTLNKR